MRGAAPLLYEFRTEQPQYGVDHRQERVGAGFGREVQHGQPDHRQGRCPEKNGASAARPPPQNPRHHRKCCDGWQPDHERAECRALRPADDRIEAVADEVVRGGPESSRRAAKRSASGIRASQSVYSSSCQTAATTTPKEPGRTLRPKTPRPTRSDSPARGSAHGSVHTHRLSPKGVARP